MRLTGPDEYFSHQTSLPHVMVASTDPSWRERYWLSIQDVVTGDTVVTLGLGKYPNQDVMEAFVCVARGDKQRNLRLSRTLSPTNDQTRVGPFAIEVVRPLRELRITLDDNPSNVSFDLTWTGTFEPILENRFFQVSGQRVTYDAIRYVQHGRASGYLRTPELDVQLTPERWWGERDHSWGTRPLPRAPGQPPGIRPEWRMLLFAPLQLPEFGVHIYLQEAEPGRPVYVSAGLSGPSGNEYDGEPIVGVEHDLEWEPGAAAPTLLGGLVSLVLTGGKRMEFRLRALPGRAHLRGGGYEGWNGWFQGHWRGEDTVEHDVWDLSDASQFYRYAKAGSDHLFEVTHQGQTGYGIVQYMVLPGYGRYDEALSPRRGRDEPR
jgi:hypothetical protein